MGKLTALAIKRQGKPGRYGDGGGLWLQVRDVDHKSWLFRYTKGGKQRQLGLGSLDLVSLAEARELAIAARKQIKDGIDPIQAKREKAAAEKAETRITFRKVAEAYIAAHQAGWKNAKHSWQWGATLEGHAYPVVGDKPVADVQVGDVMQILEPIWHTKTETASRLRGRIESVLDFARARGWREGENPARWRGHLQNLLPAKSRVSKVEHHAALPWSEMAKFLSELRQQKGTASRALEFTILTAVRTSEAAGAAWGEIDLAARIWTVPAERMKSAKEHRVPLSDAATSVLNEMRPPGASLTSGYVFPGGKLGKPLSNAAMMAVLKRMKRDDLTVHGFRSSFRDWCAEATSYPRELAEAALAHVLADKVEAAYRRGDMLAKRAALMEDWATFCEGRRKPSEASVAAESPAPSSSRNMDNL
jgi:integrase